MNKVKIGVYGGTFNPPHFGHINAAKAFAHQLKLDKLLIIPNNLPPHKEMNGKISESHRLEMCRLAFSGINIAEVSDIEIKRGGKSYTYLTLRELFSSMSELYMLVGTDMFLTLAEWNYANEIFNRCKICIVRRECDDVNTEKIEQFKSIYKNEYNADICEIKLPSVIEISSTFIRQKIFYDEEVSSFVPKNVIEYIKREGLYK